MSLANKVVLITGAGTGIGADAARLACRRLSHLKSGRSPCSRFASIRKSWRTPCGEMAVIEAPQSTRFEPLLSNCLSPASNRLLD